MNQQEIEELKKKHGDVYSVTGTYQGRELTGFLKSPDRKTIAAAMKFGKDNPMKFNETILNNVWLGGDEELRTIDECVLGVFSQLDQLIKVVDVELKKALEFATIGDSTDSIIKTNAIISYHYRLLPSQIEELSNKEWAELISNYNYGTRENLKLQGLKLKDE